MSGGGGEGDGDGELSVSRDIVELGIARNDKDGDEDVEGEKETQAPSLLSGPFAGCPDRSATWTGHRRRSQPLTKYYIIIAHLFAVSCLTLDRGHSTSRRASHDFLLQQLPFT